MQTYVLQKCSDRTPKCAGVITLKCARVKRLMLINDSNQICVMSLSSDTMKVHGIVQAVRVHDVYKAQ